LALAWEFGLESFAKTGEASAATTTTEPTKIDCAIRMELSEKWIVMTPLKLKKFGDFWPEGRIKPFGQDACLMKRKWRRR
jgi:hypothetical protein